MKNHGRHQKRRTTRPKPKAIHAEIRELSRIIAALADRRAFARRLHILYRVLVREYPRLTLVDFVRLLDPSVPRAKAGYINHRTYQLCDYLRRIELARYKVR